MVEKYVGENVKRARIKAGYTQEKLAEKVEVSWSVISRLETRRTMVSLERLDKIAQALNVPITDFMIPPVDKDYPQTEETTTLTHSNASYIAEGAGKMADIPLADEELFALIQRLPDKAKKFFHDSIRCYLENF